MAKIEKFLPNDYLNVLGRNLPAIYAAVNESVSKTEEVLQAVIDQFFLSTATGRYLIRLGEQDGFILPSNSGLDIRSYRILVPIMVADPKQIRLTIDALLAAFYGADRTRPSIDSITGPFSLSEGDDLIVATDAGRAQISIVEGQVSDFNNIQAAELAAILNNSQSLFQAIAVVDRSTNTDFLKLIAETPGPGSFIRMVGGTIQNVLRFGKLIQTTLTNATTWNLSKFSNLNDELTFTWDGLGVNPGIFRAAPGDSVTLRGFVDGADPWSLLNGSFEVVDVGFDYFTVRNERFGVVSSTVTQPTAEAITFTSQNTTTLFDRAEFAFSSEITNQTITLTVPAVPPLARRFLAGSAHIHGSALLVTDFTRNSVTVSVPEGQSIPVGQNFFVLQSDYHAPDFRRKYYQTVVNDGTAPTPLYTLNTADENQSALPFVVPEPLGANPIFGEVDSPIFRVDFPYRHGLRYAWGFTLASMTGAGGILAGDLNMEHGVRSEVSDSAVEFSILDGLGQPQIFAGVDFAAADVYRYSVFRSDGADFYVDFGTALAAQASGLVPGLTFKFDAVMGADLNAFIASKLRFRKLVVVSVEDERVNFAGGLSPGPEGQIFDSIPGKRSGYFGGNSGTYHFDKTSDINQLRVMSNLQVTFLGYTPTSNPLFVGPYLYDPTGSKSSLTIRRQQAVASQGILKGDTAPVLILSDADSDFPQSGQVVIDYGTQRQEGPISYRAIILTDTSKQILLDPSYEFQFSHSAGAQLQLVGDDKPFTPGREGQDYPFYLTGTLAARETLFRLVELLVATGVFIEQDVVLPNLRYDDPAIEPFS